MDEITRRTALRLTAGLGVAGLAGADASADEKPFDDKGEKARVMEAGLTAEEADCWLATADAAGKFFKLPKLHPMDAQEVATAIHVLQHKLLARPTYRKYLELAKAAANKKD
jgi:hypothetical protein